MTTGTNLFESLRADLKKLLHEHIMSIHFTKRDGTQRAMLCTLKSDLLPVVDKQEGDEVKKERKESIDSLRVWDIEKKDWRAFRIDSIVSHSVVS